MRLPPLRLLIDLLPERVRWTPHNLIAHPLSEILFLLGLQRWANSVHDGTLPTHTPGTGRG